MSADAAVVLPAWLDKDFAESSLKKSTGSGDISVTSVDVERATAPGDNYLSEVYRMRVELKDNVKQCRKAVSFIIKSLPDGEVMQKMAQDMQAFEQETYMFTKTIPAMSQLLRKATTGKFTQLSALCFASGKVPVDYLVLEDLKASGFTMAKRQGGLDLAHSKVVVRKLAEFHAASIGIYAEDPTAMDNYMNFRIFYGESGQHLEKFLKQSCWLLADQLETLETPYAKYAPKVRAISENIFPRLAELTKPKEEKFCVLTHADTWVNNMMFKYSEGVVKDVALLDFQLSSYCSPAIDLQYFTHTSLTEEVYANHLEDLLKEYHCHLVEVMNDLGIGTDKQISYEEFQKDFEDHSLYAFFAAVVVLPIVRTEEKTRFDVEAALNETESATNRTAYAGASYMKAMRQILPEFERKGIL